MWLYLKRVQLQTQSLSRMKLAFNFTLHWEKLPRFQQYIEFPKRTISEHRGIT